jgi:hypothetical protein
VLCFLNEFIVNVDVDSLLCEHINLKELQQFGSAEKTQEPVDAHAPHLLGGFKRMELIKIKKEQLLGSVERTQETFHTEDPTNEGGTEKLQIQPTMDDFNDFWSTPTPVALPFTIWPSVLPMILWKI